MASGSRRVSGELVRAYPITKVGTASDIIAHDEASHVALHRLAQLARGTDNVLIGGETGTGKTACAQLLNARSPTPRTLRFLNCAALSDGLLADQLRALEEARSIADAPITLCVDEVGELSPWGQAVLLHHLHARRCDTRFIAATHRDLDLMVAQGKFSRELLTQLGTTRLQLAPLRARRGDIEPLAKHFLRLGLGHSNLKLISVEPAWFEVLERYDWPGNVRELKNAILHALAINESGVLDIADLPDAVRIPAPLAKGYSR
ncbi:MAG TPA: sigma 54-interacting transcriptional regulator [Polyangiales bacterium]